MKMAHSLRQRFQKFGGLYSTSDDVSAVASLLAEELYASPYELLLPDLATVARGELAVF